MFVESSRNRDWRVLIGELEKVKREVKFGEWFGFEVRENEGFLRLINLQDAVYKGI